MASAIRIAGGMMWLVSGRFGSAVLSFISTAILARLLTPADFGVVAAAWVVLALANVVYDGAFGLNLVRKREVSSAEIRTTLTLGMLVALLCVGILTAAAPAVERFFGFPHLASVLTFASLVIPCKAVNSNAFSQLQRRGDFAAIATSSLAGQFVGNILVAVPLALLGYGIWALVAGLVVSAVTEAVCSGFRARMLLRPLLDRSAIRDVLESAFFSVASLMSWLANTAANTIVGKAMGATDLGAYSRGWKLLDLVVAATATPLSRVLLPNFSKLTGERERLASAFIDVLHSIVPMYAVLSVLLFLQAPLVVLVALGAKWGDTVPVAQILFATLVPRCAFKSSEVFAYAIGKSVAAAMRQGIYAGLMVVGTLIGLSFGIVGVAARASAAITIFYCVSLYYVMRIGNVGLGSILVVHVRAAVLSFAVGVADYTMLVVLERRGIFVRHIGAGLVGALTAAVLLFPAPQFWLGKKSAVMLNQISGRLFSR